MSENVVVAFVNTHDYPISVTIRFNKRPIKLTLWRDQRITDREGNPVIPDKGEWPYLVRLGIKPVYADVETPPIVERPDVPREEIVLDDAALMEAQEKILTRQPKSGEFLPSPPAEPPFPSVDDTAPPISHLDRKENPNAAKADLVWQDADGVWVLNKDGFTNLNPAKVKQHIKKTYGEDYLQTVEWAQYGVPPPKPDPAPPVKAS
jgi:hypothetical protein